ncbi:MAG: serine/threonine protein kinase [Planctomycetaceae bacterium]|nr:serine/threonine protein kinase [Planctomycetales bacterium]MCB9926322.1 serine/threonine protein kinase [Planctomycetaceae bacterium]
MTPERYSRVKDIFLQACELAEADRRALLAEQCGDDVELKQEVESLLAFDHTKTLIQPSEDTRANLRTVTVVQPARRSVGHKLQTFGFLTKRLGPRAHLALGALMACSALMLVITIVNRKINALQRALRAEALLEILDAKSAGLEMWFDHQEEKVESWARSEELQRLSNELIQLAANSNVDWQVVRDSPLQGLIREEIDDLAGKDVDYAIWDRRGVAIADSLSPQQIVGQSVTPFGASVLALVFEGKSKILSYDRNHTINRLEESAEIEPHVGVMAALRDEAGFITGALLVHDVDARQQTSRILRMVQMSSSGETYVFNRQGVMLSDSRFTEQLREIGLLPPGGDGGTARVIHLRDPGGDMTKGYRPKEPLSTQPLTKMARHATAGEDGVDVDGYRDYRGVRVVGAWKWIKEHDVGLATEIEMSEIEPRQTMIVFVEWVFFGLLATCLGVIVYSYYSILKLRGELGEHRQLGQYTLEQQIGEGGMGVVYKARHEFLKRPTAIKLLKPEIVDKQSIARFEREASLASQLTHPNTIDIYDYGVTPEGIFFFVMEYIEGLSLAELVQRYGPLSAARAVYLLLQITDSLSEAHAKGMIHRDLKPQNIMICHRGGKADVIKVLDFGLVKHTQSNESSQLTAPAMLAGTPLYIAPERLRDPTNATPQTDIYSLGAVMYFLLTGVDVFQGGSVADILYQVMNEEPPHATLLNPDVPSDLDLLVSDCLAKNPSRRPDSAADLLRRLEAIKIRDPWTPILAQNWWITHVGETSG